MKKEVLPQNPYLSCVEAYYLAWLSEFFDVRKLYAESFVEFAEVIKDFAFGAKLRQNRASAGYGRKVRRYDARDF